MSIVRPKILTMVEVPSGGWDLDFKISDAATLDTSLTATIAAGEYFMAWDNQADDLVAEITEKMKAAIDGAGLGTNRYVQAIIDANRKLRIRFFGSAFVDSSGHENDVEINWSTSHADLVKAAGSDGTDWTNTTQDYPAWTGDYQHGWAWYATEDHVLEQLMRHDHEIARVSQTTALDGTTKTVLWGSRYVNTLSLQQVKALDIWSNGSAYGDAEYSGLERNRGLECWWRAARGGTRFRVYRTDIRAVDATDGPIEAATNDLSSTTQLRDSGKSWATNYYAGMVALVEHTSGLTPDEPARFYIASNTATALTSATASGSGEEWDASASNQFLVFDMRYQTYILDAEMMNKWAPSEVPRIDRYDIDLPLKRYVA